MSIELKILPEFFQPIIDGRKTFEVRSTKDRTFRVDDVLRLREWHPFFKIYTGREAYVKITYTLDGSFAFQDVAIMSIKLLEVINEAKQ
jgi:hypothetical protein